MHGKSSIGLINQVTSVIQKMHRQVNEVVNFFYWSVSAFWDAWKRLLIHKE